MAHPGQWITAPVFKKTLLKNTSARRKRLKTHDWKVRRLQHGGYWVHAALFRPRTLHSSAKCCVHLEEAQFGGQLRADEGDYREVYPGAIVEVAQVLLGHFCCELYELKRHSRPQPQRLPPAS